MCSLVLGGDSNARNILLQRILKQPYSAHYTFTVLPRVCVSASAVVIEGVLSVSLISSGNKTSTPESIVLSIAFMIPKFYTDTYIKLGVVAI